MPSKKLKEKLIASFGKPKSGYFKFNLIERYFRNKDNSTSFQTLSDKTCADLDFEELFMFLDRTHSKVGQQYLYDQLRNIPSNTDQLAPRERIIEQFEKEPDFRLNIQVLLNKLNKDDAFYISSLFQEPHVQPPRWFFVIQLLSLTSLISFILLWFNFMMIFILLGVFVVNLGIHYWNKRNLYQYLNSMPQLIRLNNLAARLHKEQIFRDLDPQLTESIRIINQVRARMAFFRLEARLQSEFESFYWAMLELIKTMFLLEPLLLFGVLKQLDKRRKEIEQVFSFVGEVDLLLSIASLRHGLKTYCKPEIVVSRISARQMSHPLIIDCVPNNIDVSDRSVLITGSNMSGKTTFIRTVGINVITGLTINTCFAESISIPRICVHSAIRISDDLLNDKSYYFEEVLTIKDMIRKSMNGMHNLFLLDEIFKGTNTVERISAGKAVLSLLARNQNFVFVSTHDIELTELLEREYELMHFSEIVNQNNVDFDYKLKSGRLTNRNAIRILQINDYPEELIEEAIELSKRLDEIATTTKK